MLLHGGDPKALFPCSLQHLPAAAAATARAALLPPLQAKSMALAAEHTQQPKPFPNARSKARAGISPALPAGHPRLEKQCHPAAHSLILKVACARTTARQKTNPRMSPLEPFKHRRLAAPAIQVQHSTPLTSHPFNAAKPLSCCFPVPTTTSRTNPLATPTEHQVTPNAHTRSTCRETTRTSSTF